MADSPVTTLEVLGGVTVQLVESLEPWTLDIAALVVAVGPDGFGGLGQAMARRFPEAIPDNIDFFTVTPEHPLWVDLPGLPQSGLSQSSTALDLTSVVLATAHDPRGKKNVSRSSRPTVEASATGLLNAVQLADKRGVARLGATLLGTGMLGFDPGKVAAATVPRIRRIIESGSLRQLSA